MICSKTSRVGINLKDNMGLTIHYRLKHTGTSRTALDLVRQLHQAAQDLPFKELGEVVELQGEACKFDRRSQEDPLRWLLIQSDATLKLNKTSWLSVPPTQIIAFTAWPGNGCEAANFGLCQYPATIEHEGKRIRTKLAGWRWQSFCKTQFASDPACGGVENFLRCHLVVVAMLDRAKTLGCLASVSDESKFWENRNLEELVSVVGSWNEMLAAFAGRLKDALGAGLETPITGYSNFEQLELAGQNQLPPHIEELAKLIQQVCRKG